METGPAPEETITAGETITALSFDAALAELGEVVARLEAGGLTL